MGNAGFCPISRRESLPLKGTLLDPTSGSLKTDLIERVYIPKGPQILTPESWMPIQVSGGRDTCQPDSQTPSGGLGVFRLLGLFGLALGLLGLGFRVFGFRLYGFGFWV